MRSIIKFLFRPLCQGLWLLATLMIFGFLFHAGTVHGGTFTVTNTADSGLGSLRWAITNANANSGPDTINFDINGTAPFTINLASALPDVTDTVAIDATTQTGYSSAPVVELNGAATAAGSVGLQLNSGFNTVLGLAINRFPAQGIVLNGVSNVIQGNFIGTDTTGTNARSNGSFGIWVKSVGNQIGGTIAAARNVISGGNNTGIYIYNTSSNVVQGNYIGVSATGGARLGNQNSGITIDGSSGNLIGGGTVGARNLVSGNGVSGVFLNGEGANGNVIQGNYIGTDVTGGLVISNADDGITVNGAPSNTISGNVISGNITNGVFLSGAGAVSNLVAGNYIGTDAAGKLALGNGNGGVTITANGNLIGPSNVISGNPIGGIFLTGGASGNLVQGNFIGLSAAGTNALPNGFYGVEINGASSNTIGGSVAAARNVISGNTYSGIGILLVTDTLNTICGNYIGTDVTGKKAVPNTQAGIRILGCSNVIGGVTAGSGNVISGNGQEGIFLDGTNGNVMGNVIQGNLIGLDATGTNSLGNVYAGIGISGAANNQIGGTTAAARNVISANGNSTITGLGGVFFSYAGTTGNQFQGNYIGTDASGTLALANVNDGIYLQQADTNFIGGSTAGAGNLISANGVDGIYLTNASWNVIQGNFIGTKADGTNALGNLYHNIELDVNATNNTIGGTAPGAGNHIAFAQFTQGSGHAGVRVRNGSLNNLISENSIFNNTGLGIDLGAFGVNPNVDCESGVAANAANAGQNYPVLTNVYSQITTQIRGTLDSGTGKTYQLQFFSNSSGNTNGYGEGRVFLGQTSLTLGASCSSNFAVLLPVSVPTGWVVTATATGPGNNTSEFSAWVPVLIVPPLLFNSFNRTNRQISLSWTNNGGSYVLQQTFTLNPPALWTTVTNAPLPNNNLFVLTLSATNGDIFYRLATQ
jgi:titin